VTANGVRRLELQGKLTSSIDTAMVGQAAGEPVLVCWALRFAALARGVAAHRDVM
jgi:hypothetical protein